MLRLAGDLQGRRILDVGCGDGTLALACRESGAALVAGLDLDARMITRAAAFAAQRRATIDYTVGRAGTLPFCDRSFDVVVSVAMLTFVPEADRVIGEMARVLRPGGRLVMGDLGKWSCWAARRRVRAWFGSQNWRAARFRTCNRIARAGGGRGVAG